MPLVPRILGARGPGGELFPRSVPTTSNNEQERHLSSFPGDGTYKLWFYLLDPCFLLFFATSRKRHVTRDGSVFSTDQPISAVGTNLGGKSSWRPGIYIAQELRYIAIVVRVLRTTLEHVFRSIMFMAGMISGARGHVTARFTLFLLQYFLFLNYSSP